LQIEEQLLMDFSGYLSGVGGALGLFAGMSVLTLLQFCAAFICQPLDKFLLRLKTIGTSTNDHKPTKSELYGTECSI